MFAEGNNFTANQANAVGGAVALLICPTAAENTSAAATEDVLNEGTGAPSGIGSPPDASDVSPTVTSWPPAPTVGGLPWTSTVFNNCRFSNNSANQ